MFNEIKSLLQLSDPGATQRLHLKVQTRHFRAFPAPTKFARCVGRQDYLWFCQSYPELLPADRRASPCNPPVPFMSDLGQHYMWNSHMCILSLESARGHMAYRSRLGPYPESTFQLINRVQEFSPARSARSAISAHPALCNMTDLLGVSASSPNLCGVQEDCQGGQPCQKPAWCLLLTSRRASKTKNALFSHSSVPAVLHSPC